MKTYCRLIIAAAVFACFAGHVEAAKAKTYSKEVQRACANDYRRYCGEYGIQTSALRSCMRRVGQRSVVPLPRHLVLAMRTTIGRCAPMSCSSASRSPSS